MVRNIPSAEDFFSAGKELLDFAWSVVAELLTHLAEGGFYGVDPGAISENYWLSARRRLATALSVTYQGVEFVLKGMIAEVSPFLLLADPPTKWPSPHAENEVDFSSFRTLDAQDLVRVHDTFRAPHLSDDFVRRFGELREKRNRLTHSADKDIALHAVDVVDSLLFMHKALFPSECWASVRLRFLQTEPESLLVPDADFGHLINLVSWELELILDLLSPSQVRVYFGVEKGQRRYLCPECYAQAFKDVGFDHKLALLRPKGAGTTTLYCLVCNATYQVVRRKCISNGCRGNVISEEGLCLTCGSEEG